MITHYFYGGSDHPSRERLTLHWLRLMEGWELQEDTPSEEVPPQEGKQSITCLRSAAHPEEGR